MKDEIKLLYIDLFCGAGGTSTGIELAKLHGEKCAKVVACVNHEPNGHCLTPCQPPRSNALYRGHTHVAVVAPGGAA